MPRHNAPTALLAAVLLLAGCASAPPAPVPAHQETRAETGPIGEADGRVPPDAPLGVDSGAPAVSNLRPDLLAALRAAARAAADDGLDLHVASGWRSPRYQAQLLADAVDSYGSAAEAAKWVATPETSAHVQGAAVDVGPVDVMSWLSQHGARWGLCQTYANEPWHYELSTVDGECPASFADPTYDPRMR